MLIKLDIHTIGTPRHSNRTSSVRDAVKVTMSNDERSSDDRGEDTVMFGVAHGLRARDHAMAARYTWLLEYPSDRSRCDIVCDDV